MKEACRDGLYFLDAIPFHGDPSRAAENLKIAQEGEYFDLFKGMLDEASKRGLPKGVYRVSYIEARTEDTVTIDGITLKSRVLRVNLENVHRVFLYAVTCGRELEEWSKTFSDPLMAYFADYIKEAALGSAVKYLYSRIQKTYRLAKFATMAPGSLEDWPVEQQKPFFKILGGVEETAGIILTDTFLMLPPKSVSGIIFPSGSSFESCMLCPREKCTGRKAPYNRNLYEDKYGPGR